MENRSTHLSTWVNADLKERFAAAAARQGLSESALLKRLVEQMLAGAGEELAAERPTAVARDARVTARLGSRRQPPATGAGRSTGPAGRFGRNRPGAEPQPLPKRSSRATGTYIRSRAIDQVEPGRTGVQWRRVRTYLGVDGGGSKTLFILIDEAGKILASHAEGTAYYPEIGLEALKKLLARGIREILRQARIPVSDLTFAFFGLPSYGEDSALLATLDTAPSSVVPTERYRCGNDMVCGWAGALAGADGINVAVGTGSIVYGEYAGRSARAGGWGELFSDEGSAYWLAREGLRLFSRMSDGRVPPGALYDLVRRHFVLQNDLDLCAAIYGKRLAQRSQFAQLSRLVVEAASAGDTAAHALFVQAAAELSDIIDAVRNRLQVPQEARLAVSYSGGMFESHELLLAPLSKALASPARNYSFVTARLRSDAGAAVHAATLSGTPIDAASIAALEAQL